MRRWSDEQWKRYTEAKRAVAEKRNTPKAKPSKHRNVRTMVGQITFASKLEASRFVELKTLQQAGEISGLKLQVPFNIAVGGLPICKYVADFTYTDKTGALVVEDAKGRLTDVYKLKRRLMRVVFWIEIREHFRSPHHA